jgi:glycosyltransferase involved in cell wall biosynthesis
MKISAVLIVKNEEVLLARCLESVKEADEIIVCDTGSSDRTVEIARQFTDKVYTDYTWNDSYCEARNHAKRKATGDWILSIDADEFLEGGFEAVRTDAAQALQAVDINMFHEHSRQWHKFPRLFKNAPHIFWTNIVHNIPNVAGEFIGKTSIVFGYSPAHALDPDRSLRMLERSVRQNPKNLRDHFYLGREYYYRGRNEDCVRKLGQYVIESNSYSEKADAFMIMARAFRALGDNGSAKDACLQAVHLNPKWYEPMEFMAYLNGPASTDPRLRGNAEVWLKMCALSTNEDVLFFRAPGPETPIGRYPEGFQQPAVVEPLVSIGATANVSVVEEGTFIPDREFVPAILYPHEENFAPVSETATKVMAPVLDDWSL